MAGPLRWLVARRLRAAGLIDPYHPDCCSSVALARLVDVPAYAERFGLTDAGPLETAVAAHYAVHRPPADESGVVRFDPRAYLAANPDVAARKADPLRHFVLHAQREGRDSSVAVPIPYEPTATELARGTDRATPGMVCVIVPVHGARVRTLRCLASLLNAASDVPHRVLVVDDASPDAALRAALDALAQAGRVALLRLDRNRGFSGTVNAGLAALAAGEDVVLLNSDTEVFDHWIDRLRATAHAQGDTGTVTPLTNSGTILSYPIALRDNPHPLETSWRAIDAMARDLALPPVEIPTAVGFCMYIRRDCLDATGPFDAEAFPRGYGEENDFCQRAAALGWRHMAATDTLVYHAGSASFGSAKAALIEAGLAVLDRRYPEYQAQVRAFIAHDPLRPVRLALDCARITSLSPVRQISHWVGDPPAGFGPGDIRMTFEPGCRAVTLSCAGAPITPSLTDLMLTDMILPYDEPTAASALTLLAPAVLDLRDGDCIGARQLAKFIKIARKQSFTGTVRAGSGQLRHTKSNR
ncbi:glycosyltransferase family 2 protein [Novosphingobium sp. FKTRR1]|uniref:glycosyltransferase family 2 protein n=1 Tax=Novosphingobium sp. FKTRR1 TaxID=2879118 RepID=UPI001CEFF308|nr:glycosyltransferase family 2 protein [Novosphingobium sp. FKTRR1]